MEVSREAEYFPVFPVALILGEDWSHHPKGGGEMSHPSLAELQLVLLLPLRMPLPVFLLHFGLQAGSKQGEGHSGPLFLYFQSCK